MRIFALAAFLNLTFAALLVAQKAEKQPDPNWKAPAEAAAMRNPVANKPGAVAGGGKLFQRECAACHGRDGRGTEDSDAPDLHLPAVQKDSDGALFWKVSNGNVRHGMPSFSRLPETQRWQVVSYIRTLKASPSAENGSAGAEPKKE